MSAQDAALIAGIRAGDEAAFDTLLTTYYPGLFRLAVRYVRDHAVAEDLVSDVLFRIWAQRERWEVRTSVVTYLYGAVRNRAVNYLRHERTARRWREREEALPADERTGRAEAADAAVEVADLDQAITRAIERLPARCRQVFVLSRESGLSYAEIAAVMGISPKTVEVQMWKALKALRIAVQPFLAVALLLR